MTRRKTAWLLAALAWLGASAWLSACGPEAPSDTRATAKKEWEAFFRPPTDRIPHELATRPGTPWGDWVGSSACASCHAKEFAEWKDSFHSRTLYDARKETVFGDFSGKVAFTDPGAPFHVYPFEKDGRYWMRVVANPSAKVDRDTYGGGLPTSPEGTYEIRFAFGNRRHQPYVVKAADGRSWVPPVYWNDVRKTWRWDGWRPYVTACAPCHVTGIRSTEKKGLVEDLIKNTRPARWNVPAQEEGWADGSVGCEVCHGPGRRHVEKVKAMGDAAYRAYLAADGEPTIYDPGKDTAEHRMQQCDACHNFFMESSVTWVPGPHGYGRPPLADQIRPPSNQFYEDGTDMSPCTVGRVFRASKMGQRGVECRDCHASHGNSHWAELVAPTDDNALCLRCHQADTSAHFVDAAAIARHTRHPIDGPGSLCVECHMSRDKHFSNGVEVMSAKTHSHAMSIPTGYEDERGGPRPSCNLCHTDRDSAWTRKRLFEWKKEDEASR